ncbi:Ubiquitin carboxyl-terminal hydrolase 37 [Larimichthys crocea]|uniref:Ubiquitin carboxyl-terminal hydrolase 37 n=1 Tax=Larimichthys crocea TaxID=215358 RepID=A0A6G0I6H0_LARCR|nr:Ubiquitin carboxyl-terminal hydrolase 37 [Larimichthys crocea]
MQPVVSHLQESELEYKCECGGNTSGQSMAFETLPNVIILHLKRFIYSPTYELMKSHDPVELPRDLVVSSNQGDGCYSLISVVSHFGSNGEAGHYICDGVHPDDSLSQTTDHWLTFNDSLVRNTTGASVCEQRRESSYILFYKRHNSVADVSILSSQKRSAAATPAPVSAKSSNGGKPNKRLWKISSLAIVCLENENTANEVVLLDLCDKPSKVMVTTATIEGVMKEENIGARVVKQCTIKVNLNVKYISCFGFPNINQSCYMNSILQSLFAMVNLITDIMCQKPVWSSVPKAKLIRSLMAIKDAHPSSDTWNKMSLLHSFRKAASTQGLSFSDQNQEDAHEFLTSVLDQMRSLSSLLQVNAANMNRRYICPVKRHLVFEIEKTRTCNKCGDQSKRKEEFTDPVSGSDPLWLCEGDAPGESELEYKCECGGNTSGQSMAFETLPNVLILHIKRFIYSPTYELMKLHDPVKLHRDLVVSSNQGDGCYSLISIVSHFGSNGKAGHYICDGVHPDDSLSQTTDHWLTFNDSLVRNTTGASVCEKRRESSYILFYKRHV